MCPHGERPVFEGQDLKGVQDLSCFKATKQVFFSSGKTTGDCCLEKAELSPKTEMFPDLFTNI